MEIDKTFKASVIQVSSTSEGIIIPSGTRHHFKLEKGDTVVFEIKEIKKAGDRMPYPWNEHGTSENINFHTTVIQPLEAM